MEFRDSTAPDKLWILTLITVKTTEAVTIGLVGPNFCSTKNSWNQFVFEDQWHVGTMWALKNINRSRSLDTWSVRIVDGPKQTIFVPIPKNLYYCWFQISLTSLFAVACNPFVISLIAAWFCKINLRKIWLCLFNCSTAYIDLTEQQDRYRIVKRNLLQVHKPMNWADDQTEMPFSMSHESC